MLPAGSRDQRMPKRLKVQNLNQLLRCTRELPASYLSNRVRAEQDRRCSETRSRLKVTAGPRVGRRLPAERCRPSGRARSERPCADECESETFGRMEAAWRTGESRP